MLTDRTTVLRFDDQDSETLRPRSGVPQGSPLSPILFVLYTTPLYRQLRRLSGSMATGYADDTQIVAFAKTLEKVYDNLRDAHAACEEWSRSTGLRFNPAKYELVVFGRRRGPAPPPLEMEGITIEPSKSQRVLGVEVDRDLNWKPHLKRIANKVETQRFAIHRTMASTWGPRMRHARALYMSVLRTAIATGASAWHRLTSRNSDSAAGLARTLAKEQAAALRTILGAYKSTPVRSLETEAVVPPLDLWLNARVAKFHREIERSGIADMVRLDASKAREYLRPRQRRGPAAEPGLAVEKTAAMALAWMGRRTASEAVDKAWRERWHRGKRAITRRPRRPEAADRPPGRNRLALHKGLRKAESALLVQMRTGHIGLGAYLAGRRVPGAEARCRCGGGMETVRHILIFCRNEREARRELGPLPDDTSKALNNRKKAATLARWMMRRGRLQQFRLALELITEEELRERREAGESQ
jgi:hypothetical protein